MIRSVILAAVLMVLIAVAAKAAFCQSNRDLQTFFKHDIGLTKDQIAAIRSGQPVVKALLSRTPSEVFLFGAIYIHAAPESYIQFAQIICAIQGVHPTTRYNFGTFEEREFRWFLP